MLNVVDVQLDVFLEMADFIWAELGISLIDLRLPNRFDRIAENRQVLAEREDHVEDPLPNAIGRFRCGDLVVLLLELVIQRVHHEPEAAAGSYDVVYRDLYHQAHLHGDVVDQSTCVSICKQASFVLLVSHAHNNGENK